jgi:hypothetical protein
VSAERLREAARVLRSGEGPLPGDNPFAVAVADLLAAEARDWQSDHWIYKYRDAYETDSRRTLAGDDLAHFQTVAGLIADGRHRPAIAVVDAILGGAS